MNDHPPFDVLLLYVSDVEKRGLTEAAGAMGIDLGKHRTPWGSGNLWDLGRVGESRVCATRIDSGPVGVASLAWHLSQSGATAIVQLGMAFGTIPNKQSLGDVVVSTALFPYDRRTVTNADETAVISPLETGERPPEAARHEAIEGGEEDGAEARFPSIERSYVIEYEGWHDADSVLLESFRNEARSGDYDFKVHFGGVLTGGARIFSAIYRDELLAGVPADEDDTIGGEMEGAGLLFASRSETRSIWLVAKGISDFADRQPSAQDKELACMNSATFVLAALKHWKADGGSR
jgi:nucleoside phosphorylase